MTTIGVDTSPLQAAREWRGIGMVAAALNAGLTAAQVEALENGASDEFGSTDEMIAAAVVYGASLGIGRDEAVALLDRVLGTGADVEIEDRPLAAPSTTGSRFTEAVRGRSARIASRESIVAAPAEFDVDLPLEPMEPLVGPAFPDNDLDFDGPTPEQAVEASQEMHLGDLGMSPWERDELERAAREDDDEASVEMVRDVAPQGELETWVADRDPSSFGSVPTGSIATTRVGNGLHAGLERIVGTDRADATMEWIGTTSERAAELARTGRERLRSNEHATLIVAIGGGALLIALIVAIGGALGGGSDKASNETAGTSTTAKVAPAATPTAAAPAAKAPAKAATKPMLVPARLTVDVINTGRRTGAAKTTAATLKSANYKIGTVGNAKGGGYSTTTVLYRAGLEREGRALAKRLGTTSVRQAPGGVKTLMVAIV